jgi:Leucine-rich repeat (LRR) protein
VCGPKRFLPYVREQFGTLRTLVTLWLDDNQFESFPTCVCQLKNLKSLRLSGNAIKTVPNLITSLEALETLVRCCVLCIVVVLLLSGGYSERMEWCTK